MTHVVVEAQYPPGIFPACDATDYDVTYTTCVYDKALDAVVRDRVVYQSNPHCNPATANETEIRAVLLANHMTNLYNLPCFCDAGQVLDDNSEECISCMAGTFSVDGTYYDDFDFFTWDLSYSTPGEVSSPVPGVSAFCLGDGCDGWSDDWVLGGLRSGDNMDVNSIAAVLEVLQDFELDSGNAVTFQYRVDAERCYSPQYSCDGFSFYIDHKQVLPDPSTGYKVISDQQTYTTVTFNLTQGIHLLHWEYSKDDSFSGGEDAAYIQSITLIGAYPLDNAQTCSSCNEGYYSPTNGSTSCTQCDWFTFQPSNGQSTCKPCPDSTMSEPGASICVPMDDCTPDDYYHHRPPVSQCVKGSSGLYVSTHLYNWSTVNVDGTQRKLCGGPLALPAPIVDVPCSCDPGYEIKSTGGVHCAPCAQNYYNDGTSQTCQACPANTIPVFAKIQTSWLDEIPATCTTPGCFSSVCVGDCDTSASGWVSRGGYISTGRTIGSMQSQLVMQDVSVNAGSHLQVTCAMNCPEHDEWGYESNCDLVFVVTNSTGSNVTQFSCTDYDFEKVYFLNFTTTWKVPAAGTYTVTATFYQNNTKKDLENVFEARIYAFGFDKTTFGSAVRCAPCTSGQYFVPGAAGAAGSCSYCGIGQQSFASPNASCQTCTGNTFNDVVGGDCLSCGVQTNVNSSHTGCDINGCVFTGQVSNRQYNLMPLSRPTGSMTYAGQVQQWSYPPIAPQVFYLNPCSKTHAPTSCTDANNNSYPYMTCQTTQDGTFDLGSVLGFIENSLGNLNIMFTGGSKCSNGQHRSTNVSLICSQNSGFGQPHKPKGDIEGTLCQYNFQWETVYACPTCRPQDYQLVSGVCVNGLQRLFYVTTSPCSGTRDDSYIKCRTPNANDVPTFGYVFVVANVSINNATTSADEFPYSLSNYVTDIPTSSIIVVAVDGLVVSLRITMIANNLVSNMTASLASIVASASLGRVIGSPSVVQAPVSPPSPPGPAADSSSHSSGVVVAVVLVVLIAAAALIVAGIFWYKNRQLKYQNYRLVKEAGHDNGISNDLYDEDNNDEPVLRSSGGGMRFLNTNTAINADDDDDLAS